MFLFIIYPEHSDRLNTQKIFHPQIKTAGVISYKSYYNHPQNSKLLK